MSNQRIEYHHGREYMVEGPAPAQPASADVPAPSELAQATDALNEARAKCDELRTETVTLRDTLYIRDLERDEVRWVLGCASKLETAANAARRVVDAARQAREQGAAEMRELRDLLASAQATLDEALRVQGAIWDAVGGQRDGETLVDAVRRVVRSDAESTRILTEVCSIVCPRAPDEHIIDATRRLVDERDRLHADVCETQTESVAAMERLRALAAPRSLPKPASIEVGQWWACFYENGTRCPFRVDSMNEIAAFGRLQGGFEISGMINAMLADPRWRYLGNGQHPIDPGASALTAPPAVYPIADAIAGLALDDIAALSAAGWVMRWTAPSMRWVTPGGAALDPAVWRETLRREAARLTGKRHVVGVEGEEAKMGELDGLLSEASKRVAEWPEYLHSDDVKRRRAELDARVEAMNASKRDAESIEETKRRLLEALPNYRAHGYTPSPSDVITDISLAVFSMLRAAQDEAREAGRVEAKAEIERLRMVLLDIGRALDHRSPENIVDTAARVVRERDAAYKCGQEAMRERAAQAVDVDISCIAAARIRSLPLAKTPTVSASEVTGEAIPGAVSAETAGAGESVARSAEDAAEIARLRAEVERQRGIVEAYAAKVESYATEIASASDRLAKVRYERGRSDDALKAIYDALIDAGVTQQSDESLADAVRRALDNRELHTAKVERALRMGDVVLYEDHGGTGPAMVLSVSGDRLWLRVMDSLEYQGNVGPGSTPGTWRFRD